MGHIASGGIGGKGLIVVAAIIPVVFVVVVTIIVVVHIFPFCIWLLAVAFGSILCFFWSHLLLLLVPWHLLLLLVPLIVPFGSTCCCFCFNLLFLSVPFAYPFRFFLDLHSPILEPELDLSFGQLETMGDQRSTVDG